MVIMLGTEERTEEEIRRFQKRIRFCEKAKVILIFQFRKRKQNYDSNRVNTTNFRCRYFCG